MRPKKRSLFWGCLLFLALTTPSCAKRPATLPSSSMPPPQGSFLADSHPLRYHSPRFELAVALPDGHGWKIDDHTKPFLIATHAATRATLTLGTFVEPSLMNRQKCEEAARVRGLLGDETGLRSVADEVIAGPGAYDSRVAVAVLPNVGAHQALTGHVFLFGGYVRKCLFAHYETTLDEGEDEARLSARLAVARLQILGGLRVTAFDEPTTPHRPAAP